MVMASRMGVVAVAVALLATAAAGAQEPEVVALRAEVAQIRAQLEAVEARLRSVEASSAGVSATAPAAVATGAPPVVAAVAVAAPAAAVVAPPATQVSGGVNAAPDPAAARRIAWRQLREGQSETEVDALLGAPTKRFELSGKLVRYYYYQGVGAGSVFFDSSGHISSVQHPPGAG